ncbi:MAG: NgoFVII family restriction endonuclease [Candidatus Methanomethylophilaceae archaeon]|nr:NgoFVII family restriction endonuclease [Candidatus Methanomethylophilaceae archaeon]MDD3128178.1 NgoFVII family restriction endonuclease [Candidatus Methanomethylophilaceae archaeon]
MNEIFTNYEYVSGTSKVNQIVKEVLIIPSSSCDELHIVSGYANSSMLKRHLELLGESQNDRGNQVKIHLIIGMTAKEGVSAVEHQAFNDIANSLPNVTCSYLMCNRKACHSKTYIWLNGDKPIKAYTGSANYSQNAFFNQIESLSECDPVEAEEFFQLISGLSIYCNHDEVEDAVEIVPKKKFLNDMKKIEGNLQNNNSVIRLPLLDKKGKIHKASGLNWGQREGREPNQAYIAIPREIGKSEFFPPKKQVFALMTDDGFVMQCVTQGNESDDPIPKQLTTTNNNSEIGKYFRRRLDVPEGEPVTENDLKRYGRSDVTIFKLDDGTYYMNFKSSKNADD